MGTAHVAPISALPFRSERTETVSGASSFAARMWAAIQTEAISTLHPIGGDQVIVELPELKDIGRISAVLTRKHGKPFPAAKISMFSGRGIGECDIIDGQLIFQGTPFWSDQEFETLNDAILAAYGYLTLVPARDQSLQYKRILTASDGSTRRSRPPHRLGLPDGYKISKKAREAYKHHFGYEPQEGFTIRIPRNTPRDGCREVAVVADQNLLDFMSARLSKLS